MDILILEWFKKLFRPQVSVQQGQLIPGVEKPTTTLAKMIAAEIVKDLPPHVANDHHYTRTYDYFDIKTDKFNIEYRYNSSDKEVVIFDIRNPKSVSFDDREKQIICNAIQKAKELLNKQAEIHKEEANQHNAIDHISKWMGINNTKEAEKCEA